MQKLHYFHIKAIKTIINFIISFLLLPAFVSCTNKEKSEFPKINFPMTIHLNLLRANTDSMNLSEIAERVEYIPLQTTDSSMMEYIDDFIITHDYIFIKDGLKVLKYDKNGRFIRSMFNVGRGPEEAFPVCFTVDEVGKLVYVFDRNKYVKIYDYNGKYQNTIKKLINPLESLPPWSIGFFNNNLFISIAQRPKIKYIYSCFDLKNDSIRIIYKNNRKYDKLQEEKWPAVIPYDYDYQITDSTIMFKEKFCDTIFKVDKNFMTEPRYIIDLGTQKLEWEDWRDYGMFGFASGLPYGYWVQSFKETKTFLFLVLTSHKGPELFTVYDKSSDSVKIFTIKSYKRTYTQVYSRNDLDNLVAFPPMDQNGYLFFWDGCLFSVIEAKDFTEAYRSATPENKNSTKYLKNMVPFLSTVTEFSNPIIMKVYLK
jgi:hypothetical protein